jgi:hypothetical protein
MTAPLRTIFLGEYDGGGTDKSDAGIKQSRRKCRDGNKGRK